MVSLKTLFSAALLGTAIAAPAMVNPTGRDMASLPQNKRTYLIAYPGEDEGITRQEETQSRVERELAAPKDKRTYLIAYPGEDEGVTRQETQSLVERELTAPKDKRTYLIAYPGEDDN